MSIKNILKKITDNGKYYAELVDNIAEVYLVGDEKPCVMLEFDKNMCHMNLRADLIPEVSANIILDFISVGATINIGSSFYHSSDGLVYGQEAIAKHYMDVYSILQTSQAAESTSDNVYIVKKPIYGYGVKQEDEDKKKYKKMWGE